ncbi:hypothetical protein SDC9_152573 [bioreactor metagenome]|uniref:Uncharacterized protein n=1 Tax=bioreactor metagenome TaxID=1076179 RepID=A0A645EXV7_9ZZZZ
MVLFDGRSQDAGDADAVAAHFEVLGFAIDIEERGVHRLRVLGAKVEHVADLDAALDGEYAPAVGRRIALDHIADIGNDIRLGKVASPVGAGVVEAFVVGTADEISHVGNGTVSDDANRFFQADRTEIARLAAEVLDDFGFGGEAESGFQAVDLASLDFVEFMVAAHQQQPYRTLDDLAVLIGLVAGQYQRFDRRLQWYRQQLGHLAAGGLARGRGLDQCSGGR